MFGELKVFTKNKVWRNILNGFGIIVSDSEKSADISIDELDLKLPVCASELLIVLNERKEKRYKSVLQIVFKKDVDLPKLQAGIIFALFKKEQLNIDEIKNFLGFLPDTKTRTVENAIYQLRQKFGKDIIKNKDGKYYIGKL